jgi:hypothetical protein
MPAKWKSSRRRTAQRRSHGNEGQSCDEMRDRYLSVLEVCRDFVS